MTAAIPADVPTGRASQTHERRPVLTGIVLAVTLVTSVAALFSPALMDLFARDLPRLRAGQWWRVATPVLVQPSGWGQLVFNLLGIAVVGATLQRRFGWVSWSLIYLAGGTGSIAVYSAWHPTDTGGGSSAAAAALIGAFLVGVNLDGMSGRLDWFATIYSLFFAVYLTMLDVGGVTVSIIAGNATIIVAYAARRALNPTTLARGSLLVVLATGVAMILARDDHGVGIAIGVTLAGLVLARRQVLSRPSPRLWRQTAFAVPGVVAAALLTWVSWDQLLGITLVTTQSEGRQSRVGWLSVTLVSATSCLAASLALRRLKRDSPTHGIPVWTGLCLGIALISLVGPLTMSVGTASTAALISLHVVCAATILALLAPSASPSDATSNARRRATHTAGASITPSHFR